MINRLPYKDPSNPDRWTIDTDPDDELYYVADVRQWLQDSSTTAASFEVVTEGVTVMDQGEPQGDLNGLLPVKLKVPFTGTSQPFCTFRIDTEDNQQFDKTIWFKQVEN